MNRMLLGFESLLPHSGSPDNLPEAAGRLIYLRRTLPQVNDNPIKDERDYHQVVTTIGQTLSWISTVNGIVDYEEDTNSLTPRDLKGIYSLGRLYFTSGFGVTAEKIFSGLRLLDGERMTPVAIGNGVVELATGKYEDAIATFHGSLIDSNFVAEAQMGLVICYISLKEKSRAKVVLEEVEKSIAARRSQSGHNLNPSLPELCKFAKGFCST